MDSLHLGKRGTTDDNGEGAKTRISLLQHRILTSKEHLVTLYTSTIEDYITSLQDLLPAPQQYLDVLMIVNLASTLNFCHSLINNTHN